MVFDAYLVSMQSGLDCFAMVMSLLKGLFAIALPVYLVLFYLFYYLCNFRWSPPCLSVP